MEHCDIAAVKGDELIVVETKKSFSTALLIQATQRQRTTDSVYVALLKPKPSRSWPGIRHLLKRLELGLILVSPGSPKMPVRVVFHPVPFQRHKRESAKRAVLLEAERRTGDLNPGGSHRRQIVTAYREQAIHIACCLRALGSLSPKSLRGMGTGPKTQPILHANVYGWFERVDVWVYTLGPQGHEALAQYPELAKHFLSFIPKRKLPPGREGTN